MTKRLLAAILLAGSGLAVVPSAAMADTVVPAGHTVVEVTVIGQDVTLNGTSAGSVVVVDGNLTIGPHGRAENGVTLIGGRLTTAPGAQIAGDVFQLGGPIPHPSGWLLAAALVAFLVMRTIVVWVIVRIARQLAAWPTSRAMLAASRRRPIRSTLAGALLTVGLFAAGILLAVSIVGLILAAAILAVMLLSAALGVSFVLDPRRPSRDQTTTVAGALLIAGIGDALLALATIVALGAALHYLIDERSARSPLPTQP